MLLGASHRDSRPPNEIRVTHGPGLSPDPKTLSECKGCMLIHAGRTFSATILDAYDFSSMNFMEVFGHPPLTPRNCMQKSLLAYISWAELLACVRFSKGPVTQKGLSDLSRVDSSGGIVRMQTADSSPRLSDC